MKNFFFFTFPIAAIAIIVGCQSQSEQWQKSPGLEVTVQKEYENGKPYLTVFYENFGSDTIEKIQYQLISIKNGRADTSLREIDPPQLLLPKDQHVVARQPGEDTLAADEVHVGRVLAVKK